MVKILKQPSGMTQAPDYTMTADGKPVPLSEFPGLAGGTAALAFLEIGGAVKIEIKCNSTLKSAQVHPISYGIHCNVKGQTVSFTLSKPGNIFVKFNESFALPVYIFASELSGGIREIDEKTIYYPSGVYDIGCLELKSGQTLWLEDGAVLNGTVRATDAENISIKGNGVIKTSHIAFGGEGDGGSREVIGLIRCKNVEIDGITILDSFSWTVTAYECDYVHINNIRIINQRLWSTDGINPCNSAHVLIENCFIRSKDDCVSVKGLNAYDRPCAGKKPIEDILVRNCVFWSDNNNVMVVGSETMAEYIRGICFKECDVLKASGTCADNAGVMSVICLHDGDISDIRFENIRVEYTESPLINMFYTDEIFRIPGRRSAEGGSIRDITFKNITLSGGPMRWSLINGMNEKHSFDNVEIENLTVFGKRISTADEAELTYKFVNGFTIK